MISRQNLLRGSWSFAAILVSTFALAAEPEAMSPSAIVEPFAGNDLSKHFTTWLKRSKLEDPEHVFQLKEGVLRCGDEDMGYVATRQTYKDYWLTMEYKWGRKNPHDKYVRNSGLLLHGTGPDGSASGVWMTSIECQLAQGCEGDLILIPGKNHDGKGYPATIASRTKKGEDGKPRFDLKGDATIYTGRQFWWSQHQPFFEELIDTRGKDDVASPLGEWTRVTCLCQANRAFIYINGVLVNGFYDANPAAGKILLQAEGHEVYFRNLQIGPLPKSPAVLDFDTVPQQEPKRP